MHSLLRKNKGITLIELLVALVITGILVGAIYRTFIGQQKTYTVQEQVVDMQQNVRAGINRMMREIRMAGFGASMVLPVMIGGQTFGPVNPNKPAAGALTIVSAMGSTSLTGIVNNQITVSDLKDSEGNTLFDLADRKYVSIGGLESYTITNIAGKTLTLNCVNLTYDHPVGTLVYGIRAISYQVGMMDGKLTLLRDENTGAGGQPLADNIEGFEFKNPDGSIPLNPNSTSMLVTVTARTDRSDPELLKTGDGYRRRQITSRIHMRNRGL